MTSLGGLSLFFPSHFYVDSLECKLYTEGLTLVLFCPCLYKQNQPPKVFFQWKYNVFIYVKKVKNENLKDIIRFYYIKDFIKFLKSRFTIGTLDTLYLRYPVELPSKVLTAQTAKGVELIFSNLAYRPTVYKIGMAALDYIQRHSTNCKRATKSHSYSILNPWLDCSGRGFAAEFFGGF